METAKKVWFGFEKSEIRDVLLVILVLGFCFSFRNWGSRTFDFGLGIANFVLTTILVAIALLLHEYFHKYIAYKYGASVGFSTWRTVLLIAVLLCFLTDGWFVFAAVWAITIKETMFYRPRHRRPHIGPHEQAKIGAAGPVMNLGLAIISAGIAFSTGSFIWSKFMFINLWMAGMNLFPFFRVIVAVILGNIYRIEPQLIRGLTMGVSWRARRALYGKPAYTPHIEGELIFLGSKPLWIALFSFFCGLLVLLYLLQSVSWAVLLAIILTILIYIWWQWRVEHWARWQTRKSNPIRKKAQDRKFKPPRSSYLYE